MPSELLRLLRRLTEVERTALIVGGLLITAMLSAVAVDRALERRQAAVVITVVAPPHESPPALSFSTTSGVRR